MKNYAISSTSPQSSDNAQSLQAQLSFMGLVNGAQINSASKIGEQIFQDGLSKLHKEQITPNVILGTNKNALYAMWMLLDEVKPFSKAIDDLLKTNPLFEKIENSHFPKNFNDMIGAQKAAKNGNVPDFKIRGVVGIGSRSKAFLTDDYKVLKFGQTPNVPTVESFINNFDVPVYDRFHPSENVYGALEQFLEVGDLKLLKPSGEFDSEEFKKIHDGLSEKLKQTQYPSFINVEFKRDIDEHARQTGFRDGKWLLLDAECVKKRPLWGQNL